MVSSLGPLFSSVWAMASAVAIAALGVLSMRGGRSRPRGALAFGAFCIAWGLEIGSGNLASLLTPEKAVGVLLAFATFSFAATYFLVEFGASQSPTGNQLRWRLSRVAAAVLGFLGAAVLTLQPDLFFSASARGVAQGPLFLPLLVIPQFAAFAAALAGLWAATKSAPTDRTRRRASLLLAGIGLYAGFIAGYEVTLYVVALDVAPGPEVAPFALVFAAFGAVVLALAVAILHAGLRSTRRQLRRSSWLLAASLLVPFAWGAIEGAWTDLGGTYVSTVGLWRLLGAAIITYGLARWRHFDLPQRTARAAASVGGAAVAAAGGAAAYGAGTLVSVGPLVPALAALVVAGFTFLPGVRFARRLVYARLVAPATPDATDEALYGQRLDAYRAALEASIARGTEDEDATFLAALRERFRIDESEHRVLLHYARSSVLIASRSGDNAEHAYERLRLLGEGGAGRTWLARDRLRDRLVVLKEPLERWQRDPKLREAVLREARLAARVRHPNVLSVEEVVEHRGLPVLVLEYAEGGSVADLLRRRGALPWRDAVALQLRILRGVEAIHAAGIVHRDLKPSNVLLASDGSPKVADFGIAIPATTSSTLVEGSTSFVGTMSYVAPEVLAGAVGDPRSDVYSCAAILHECLYGAPPGQPPLPGAADDAPAGLRAVLSDALAADPHRRPPSARALAEALTSRAGQ